MGYLASMGEFSAVDDAALKALDLELPAMTSEGRIELLRVVGLQPGPRESIAAEKKQTYIVGALCGAVVGVLAMQLLKK